LARETGKPEKSIAPSALQQLMEYSWPGNIRQLQHVMERHSLVGPSNVIEQVDLPDEPVTDSDTIAPPGKSTAVSQEKEDIIDALNKCEGKISGKGGAAELLGINPNTFCSRMRKHGIRWKFI
jgi:transcriptional regulator of acetoin/glycerol metabolism